jgi:hypothetical protein
MVLIRHLPHCLRGAVRMIVQGILHLLTGFDHLAFLFVALLAVVRKRDANDPGGLRSGGDSRGRMND